VDNVVAARDNTNNYYLYLLILRMKEEVEYAVAS
jgi:hypothetical protein